MTEEIIVDNVNVAGCEHHLSTGYCQLQMIFQGMVLKLPFGKHLECDLCDKDCYYKQLKRLEQENNYLQAQLNNITVQSNNAITALEQENKELKEAQKGLVKRITYFESVMQKTFNCLIKANANGKITDTLWVTNLETLWDMLATALRIENTKEYENEVLR